MPPAQKAHMLALRLHENARAKCILIGVKKTGAYICVYVYADWNTRTDVLPIISRKDLHSHAASKAKSLSMAMEQVEGARGIKLGSCTGTANFFRPRTSLR